MKIAVRANTVLPLAMLLAILPCARAVAQETRAAAEPATAPKSRPATSPASQPASQPATQPFIQPLLPTPTPELDRQVKADVASPDSIDQNLKDAKSRPAGVFPYGPISLIDPYWRRLNDELRVYGLDVGLTYTSAFQAASGGPGDRQAAGDDFDLFGKWRLLGPPDGRDNGYLYFDAECRDRLGTDISPNQLSGEIGSPWGTANSFNTEPLTVRDLYWQQHFGEDALILRVGKIDPSAYYDSNYWQSDGKFFMNQAFSSFPARAFPQDGLGVNATVKPSDLFYVSAGVQDAEGDRTLSGFNTFFDDFNLFAAAELGVTPDIAGVGKGTYRFTPWYRDAGDTTGTRHDGGFSASFDQHVGEHLIPFFRYGFSQGNVAKVDQMISAGVGWRGKLINESDVVGLGMSWGQPSDNQKRDQYVAELFYRLQVSPDNQLTIGYQLILDPTDAPDQDVVGVFELRWRLSL